MRKLSATESRSRGNGDGELKSRLQQLRFQKLADSANTKKPAREQGEWKDVNKENDALRARIREVEDENQELQAQSLIQNRTILSMRNELALMRIQLNEMAVTSALLTERVRQLMQSSRGLSHPAENDSSGGQITAPPLMAPPPPPPPPISPTYIRISPRQVGAGEALMTRLGLTIPTPPRHRIKRDNRQSIRRLSRSPTERHDSNDTSSAHTSLIRPKTVTGLTKIPQLHGSFLYSQATATISSDCNESASDSSDSEEDSQSSQRRKSRNGGLGSDDSGGSPLVHKTILQNYNFTFPTSTAKLFLPMSWERKDKDNHTLPSTSRNCIESDVAFVRADRSNCDLKRAKISECVQYTFPNAHEGSHAADVRSVATAIGQSVRMKPSETRRSGESEGYRPEIGNAGEESAATSHGNDRSEDDEVPTHIGFESESQSSTDDDVRRKESERGISPVRNMRFDTEQDGFQADESSNCITSTENSLERVAISEPELEKN